MEKETMIANVRKMMQYADEKMKGVVKEDVYLTLERSPYHYIKFAFYPNKQGSCIEFGSWGGTYDRMFADVATEYGGWCGGEKVYTYEKVHSYVTRSDMMRLALIRWQDIKNAIGVAVAKEDAINNFVL